MLQPLLNHQVRTLDPALAQIPLEIHVQVRTVRAPLSSLGEKTGPKGMERWKVIVCVITED